MSKRNNKGLKVTVKDLTYHKVMRSTEGELEARLKDLKGSATPQQVAEMEGDLEIGKEWNIRDDAKALQYYQAAGDSARVKEKRGCCYASLSKHVEAIAELRPVESELSFLGVSSLVKSLWKQKGFIVDEELQSIADKLLGMPGLDCALPFTTAADLVPRDDPEAKLRILEDGIERLGGNHHLETMVTDICLQHHIGAPRDIYNRIAQSNPGARNQSIELTMYRTALWMEDMDLAIQHLDAAIGLAEEHAWLLALKIACLLEIGRTEEVDELITKVEAASPFTETYNDHSWQSWSLSFTAGRLRILAAIKAGDEVKLAQAVSAYAKLVQEHPEELLSNPEALVNSYTSQPQMSLVPQRHRISEAAVKPDARGVMTLMWYLYDREQGEPGEAGELEQLAGKIGHPLLRHVAAALAASDAQKWRTAGQQITLAEIESRKNKLGIALPSILDDVKWKNMTATEQIIKGYCAAIESLPADMVKLYGYPAFSLFRNHLTEHSHHDKVREAVATLMKAGATNTGIYFDLGWALHDSKQEEAALNYRKVLEAEPRHYGALYNLHLIADDRKSVEDLRYVCDRAAEAQAEEPDDDRWEELKASCNEKILALSNDPVRIATAELRQRLDRDIDDNKTRRIDYDALPDGIAIILLALDRTLGEKTYERRFFRAECASLTPVYYEEFLTKLYQANAIHDDPLLARPDAYFLKDGKIFHYNDKTAYFVVPDHRAERPRDGMMILENRRFSDAQAIHALWLDYSESDCMAYLFSQLDIHGLKTTSEADNAICATLRTALQTYSVAELWSVIWKIARDAAALARREYYTVAKAEATIPRKLARHLEAVGKGKEGAWVKEWDRPHDQPSGTLGQVFFEYFGLDEKTRGLDVSTLIASKVTGEKPASFGIDNELSSAIKGMFQRVAQAGTEAELLANFAAAIKEGLSFEDAVRRMEEISH